MKILCIGNSFSCDATRYLHGIAHADGVDMEIVNLYIGGCPLDRHFRNMKGDYKDYTLFFNGQDTGFKMSIKEALLSREWDVITVQQASKKSYKKDTYYPYITELVAYVRENAPNAKVLIHETWAYEEGSAHLKKVTGFDHYDEMMAGVKEVYYDVCEKEKLDGLIPSGEMLGELVKRGIPVVHRPDGAHASFGIGRYALGLLWYRVLTGNTVAENTFKDFDLPIPDEEIAIAKAYVDELKPIDF
jgi:hypothetical protein